MRWRANGANSRSEVTQALTRKYLNPSVPDHLYSLLPSSTDMVTKAMTKLGLQVIFTSLERLEMDAPLIEPPISVSSSHTKHHLEDIHPNICVFRHPDHLPDKQNMASIGCHAPENGVCANENNRPKTSCKACRISSSAQHRYRRCQGTR